MAQLLIPRELRNLDRSTSKLTDLAKRVAIPRDIVGTDWGPVADTCRNEMGIVFDGWQDGMGQLMMARSTPEALHEGGMLAHTVGGFNLSAMRQIGKTFWGTGALFGLCQHYPGLLVIWTSHHTKTTSESFESMQGFAKRRLVEPFIEKVYTGSGDEQIKFWNGSRIMFGARERGFPRGIPGVDVLFNDEGQIMSEKAQQAGLATMNTSWLGLHIYAGTPPSSEEMDKAKAWMRKHDEAWVIKDPDVITVDTDDMVWVEFGADSDAELDDVRQWARNPSVPHRTPFHAMQRLRRNLNDDGFRREGLGLYDEDEGSIFNLKRWDTLAIENAPQPERASLVLDVSPDREWASLGIAAEYDDERTLLMVTSIKGTSTAVKAVVKMAAEKDLITVRITPGAARAIETQLTKAGIEYDIMPAAEVAAGYGTLQEAIKDGTIVHLAQPELYFALQNSKTRFLQTGESETIDRRGYTVDVSPAVAVAGALYDFGINNSPMPMMM